MLTIFSKKYLIQFKTNLKNIADYELIESIQAFCVIYSQKSAVTEKRVEHSCKTSGIKKLGTVDEVRTRITLTKQKIYGKVA